MDELERQLRDLAAHRASQVPEFDASSLDAGVGSRRPPLSVVLAIAALIVAFLVVGGYVLFGRNDSDSVRVAAPPSSSVGPGSTSVPTTAPSTTIPPVTCPATNNDTSAQSGPGTVTSVPPLAQSDEVEIWSSQCVDEVTFSFSSTVPGWTVSYRTGPLTLEPSGQPVTIAGSAYLVVQFENASSSGSDATDLRPQPPVGVSEVRKVQDFEGVVTWVIGLDSERPFGVSTDTQAEITIDLPAVSGPRSMSCTNPDAHNRVDIPAGWFVQVSESVPACSRFAMAPVPYLAGDAPPPGPVAELTDVPFASLPETPESTVLASTRTATVDGRAARVTESTYSPGTLFNGQRRYQWSIDWGSAGTLTVFTIEGSATSYDVNKSAADQIASSARFVP